MAKNTVVKKPSKFYVFSKMSAGVTYNDYADGGADLPVIVRKVTIQGGAGIANKNLITPLGVMTEVDADDMEFLNRNGIFQQHKKNGFIAVEAQKAEVEKVVADMAGDDPSAPMTPADFIGQKGPKPSGVELDS